MFKKLRGLVKQILAILTSMLLLGAFLTACTVAEPALSPDKGTGVPEETLPIEPEPGVPKGTATIEAEEGTAVPEGKIPSENNEVSWTEALEILNNGDVKLVSQSHNLEVSLVLNDGRTITTVEPSLDAIFDAIAECGEACSTVVLVTE